MLELIGVEEGQRRLEGHDHHAEKLLAGEVGPCRPPDGGAGQALEFDEARARRRPDAVNQRQHDRQRDAGLHRQDHHRQHRDDDQSEFGLGLAPDVEHFRHAENPPGDEQQHARQRRLRHDRQ